MKLEKMEACHSWGGGVSAKTWSCCCFYSSQCNCLVSGNRTYSLDCCFTTTTLFGSKAGSFLQGSRSESLAHDDVVTEQWSSCRCTSRNVPPPHWSRSPYIENQTARTPQVLSLLSPSLNWFSIQTYGSKVSVLSDSVYVVHRSRGEGDWTLGWNKVGKAVSNLKPPPFFSPCFQC